jgi:hypothetical protein
MTASTHPETQMRLGRILSRALAMLVRRLLFALLLAAVLLYAPALAMSIYFPTPHNIFSLDYAVWNGMYLVQTLVVCLFGAWAARALSSDVRTGKVSSQRALVDVLLWYVPVASTAILVSVGGIIGSWLLLVPGIIWGLAVTAALPAAINEKLGPVAALKRSFDLTRRRRGILFGFGLLTYLPLVAALIVAELAANSWTLVGVETQPIVAHWIRPISTALLGAFAAAFYAATYEELLAVPAPPPPE